MTLIIKYVNTQRRNSLNYIGNFNFFTNSTVDDRPDEVVIYELKKQYIIPKIKNKININFKDVITPDNLIFAWSQIKKKPSSIAFSITSTTPQNLNREWFEKTSDELSKGTFIYPSRKCIFISKLKDFNTTKLTTMTNLKIKIIEKAFLNELEKYFEGLWVWKQVNTNVYDTLKSDLNIPKNDLKIAEKTHYVKKWIHRPIFFSSSYGFRSNRSPHTALSNVKHWRVNTTWILNYDVRKKFDDVNRNRLENIFSSYIDCPQLWQEVAKMLKIGIVQPDIIYEKYGVPQNKILSPFLFNIYMTELDKYIERLKDTIPHEIPDFEQLKQAKKKYDDKWNENLKETHVSMYSKIQYVRYANDFLIGIVGTKSTAKWVREKTDTFIKSDLHLEVKQNTIIHSNDGSVLFLGFSIYLSYSNSSSAAKLKPLRATQKYKDRILARLKTGDAKLAKAALFNIKRLLIQTIRMTLEKNTKKFSKENVQQSIQDILVNLPKNSNLALYRWEKNFSDLFHQNQTLGLKYHHKQLISVAPSGNEDSSIAYIKLDKLRKKYIKDIDKIQNSVIKEMIYERQQQIIKEKQKYLDSKDKFQLPNWTQLSTIDIRSAAELLVREQLNHKKSKWISIRAPMNKLIQKLVDDNFLHPLRKKPIGNPKLTQFNDGEIIHKYSEVMHSLLEYYSPADNFSSVKNLVEYLRKSCILTLAMCHKKSKPWAYKMYGLDCNTTIGDKYFALPTIQNVANQKSKFNNSIAFVTKWIRHIEYKK